MVKANPIIFENKYLIRMCLQTSWIVWIKLKCWASDSVYSFCSWGANSVRGPTGLSCPDFWTSGPSWNLHPLAKETLLDDEILLRRGFAIDGCRRRRVGSFQNVVNVLTTLDVARVGSRFHKSSVDNLDFYEPGVRLSLACTNYPSLVSSHAL